jgi:hypothetical protein
MTITDIDDKQLTVRPRRNGCSTDAETQLNVRAGRAFRVDGQPAWVGGIVLPRYLLWVLSKGIE